ncbi:uncharacterized protein LODBEIA_P59510 [Lodderomyces beijingensis]|uniref:Heat shock protein SSC1, mitochondrial n=1 Tax=Lodderomyces beijingensis TaxID=1775926 RepID=A0ABP0ZUC4_9ASCO
MIKNATIRGARHSIQRALVPRRYKHNVIGIDLGTTNSAVAVVGSDNEPHVLENDEGKRTTPSVVVLEDNNHKTLVGLPAKRQALLNPRNTFFATKRLIGRKFEDPEVQRDIRNVPYKIVPDKQGDAALQTSAGRNISPSEIGGLILEKMREIASSQLKEQITEAVVTVPAYFNDSQRQATKNSGKLVGLNVLRVINEPTAAALAYGCDKTRKEGVVAVFDFGGGTFDVSILDIEDGVFEVRATNGNTHLGGEDFDIVLLHHILASVKNQTNGVDLSQDHLAVQRLREAAEQAKIELSTADKAEIKIPFVRDNVHVDMTITRDEFDAMTMPLIEKVIDPVKRCVRDAELKMKDIDEVLLVGGMTRMPKIRQVVAELFGKEPSTAVNPDEAVALGAAIQGAILSGQVKNVVLLDVTPLSLGIETYGGIFSPLIPRNSAVPIKKEQIFSTAVDGQTGVEIRVYQGERMLVKDNKLIGHFKLANIPQGPKGTPQIAVEFEIDADGIISVSASDKTPYPSDSPHYGKPNSVSIQVTEVGLSDSEVEKMIEESERNKNLDEEMRRYYEHASRADILVKDTEIALIQFGEQMEEAERNEVKAETDKIKRMVEDIRSGAKLHDPKLLTQALNEMQQKCMNAIKKIAEKQQKGV